MKYPKRPSFSGRIFPAHPRLSGKPVKDSFRQIFWVVGILFFILVVVFGFAIFILTSSEGNTSQSQETTLYPKTSAGSVACDDWDCFADRAENCEMSNFENTISIDFLGLNITTTTYYELRGMENEKCSFYFRTEEQHIGFTDEIQQMIDNDASLEEIAELEETKKGMNEVADLLEGREAFCSLDSNQLASLFSGWKTGNFSGGSSCKGSFSGGTECEFTGDSEYLNDCKGSFFDTELGGEESSWEYGDSEVNNNGANSLNNPLSNFQLSDEEYMIESIGSLNLSIDLSKNSYEVGEIVDGKFTISYEGDSFKGIILYKHSREGCDKEYYYTRSIRIIETGISNGMALEAFKLKKTGESSCNYMSGTGFFQEEGNYIFGISVYNCYTTENELNKGCSDVTLEEIRQLVPIKSASKNVLVEGGSYVSECELSSDCTGLCEGCENGEQRCVLPSEMCVDCFMNSHCKEGYRCEDNTCVLE